jgi:hypothetical protein
MAAQVQHVVGVQLAKLSADNLFFAKAQAGIVGALAWLEDRLEPVLAGLPAPRDVSVFEVTLFCLMEHLAFRPTLSLAPLPKLRAFAASYAARESAKRTVFRYDPVPRHD